MEKPNFFIIGAPKCGTSTLINELRWHPQIYVPLDFEPQWFSSDFNSVVDHDEASYMRLFAGVTEQNKAIGEKSVIYMYSEVAIDNILQFNPDSRFIVMLRNPVDLVYSWHSQLYYSFIEDEENFTKAWELQDSRRRGKNIGPRCPVPFALQYKEIGSLGKYLQRALAKIPRDKLHVIFMEDYHADPEKTYVETLDFLDVAFAPRADKRRLNSNKRHRYRWLGILLAHDTNSLPSRWLKKFDQLPLIKKLRIKQKLHQFNKIEYQRSPLPVELKKRLQLEFKDDIQLLTELTGRDLSHWLQQEREDAVS